MRSLLPLLLCVRSASAHGAVVSPPPRNAVDAQDPAQANSTYPYHGQACPSPDGPARTTGNNGQACYWFSNGCSIGCDTCDGHTRGPAPDWPSARRKQWSEACEAGGSVKATVCDPALRTVNTGAECGGKDDWYYYSPWRAPGSSGVFDSCGMAGGSPKPGGYGAEYVRTQHAKQGDLGSVSLARAASGTVWKRGSVVEVSWTILANHGGGYQYRLCPASQPLTEDCFFKTPLAFVGQQGLRWDAVRGKNGTELWFDGVYVSTGTKPEGSAWAKNPIPRNDVVQTQQGFEPACVERPECVLTARDSGCLCSGMWGPYNLEIVDRLRVPSELAPGEYVLGWRWDCEESNQIWASCSDLTIV